MSWALNRRGAPGPAGNTYYNYNYNTNSDGDSSVAFLQFIVHNKSVRNFNFPAR